MYTQDIYYRLFPKLLPYTSAGIPIHHRPIRLRPHDRHNRTSRSRPSSTSSPPSSRHRTCRSSADGTGSAHCGKSPSGWTVRPRSFRPAGSPCESPWANCITPVSASPQRPWRTTSPMSGRRCAGSAKKHDVPQQRARLSAEWTRFRDRLDKRLRQRLYSLIRHCSARGIDLSSVDDEVFDHYWRYRTKTTGRASNNTARRFMIRAWNTCAVAMDGWGLRQAH